MNEKRKLVLFGDSAFGEVAYEMFTHDSPYEVAAFTVSSNYLGRDSLFGVPVVPFEDIEQHYAPEEYDMHVALVYNNLNRNRANFYREAKKKGYKLANYVSSRAFLWHNVSLGDNVFIFEGNTVQPFVKIGSDVVLWSGNHIGHHSVLGNHLFVSSHVVINGFCKVGDYCFFGVNSTVANNINIGNDCLIGAGCLIVKDTDDGQVFNGVPSVADDRTAYEKFNIDPPEF